MNVSLIELSDFIRLLGLAYLAGIVISTSGVFPAFAKSQFSNSKYDESQTLIQRKQLGWSFGLLAEDESNAKATALTWIAVVVLIAVAYFGMRWAENAQIPALNITLGITCIFLGLNYRRLFLRKWAGKAWKIDFASFLVGLFILITQI